MLKGVKNKYINNVKDFSQVFSWCIKLSWQVSPIYTVLRVLSELFNPILNILGAFISKQIINYISSSIGIYNSRYIYNLLILMGLVALIKVIMVKVQVYTRIVHSEQLDQWMVKNMIDFSFDVDLAYFDDPSYQDKITSAMRDGAILVQALGSSISAISAAISLLIAFIILSKESIVYALLMVSVAIPSGAALKYYTESLYDLSLEQVSNKRKLSYIESIAFDRRFSQDMRLFQSSKILKDSHSDLWETLFNQRKKILKERSRITLLLDFLPEIVLVIISGHIIFNILDGKLLIGDYVFLTGLLGQLWYSTSGFIASTMEIIENKLRMNNYQSLFKYTNKIRDEGQLELNKVESIEFENVSFIYPLSKKYALKDISFYISSPEHVAFIGLNGSGKSTLIKLLLRFYEPTSGTIKINDINIRSYSIFSLRNAFSVYFQDMSNFAFSIRTNFHLTNPNESANDNEMIDALDKSDFMEVLNLNEDGLDAYISKFFTPDGLILSGGQAQKLALARVLYRKNTILILDEVSSNLDPEAEHEIFNKLQEITEDRLTLFTSHRLSNLSLADRVIVLEDGKIIEDGKPEKLLKDNKRYAELFRYQQKKYMIKVGG
jgi:ABC-type multidrug transport system fused ATPase/permease subunit